MISPLSRLSKASSLVSNSLFLLSSTVLMAGLGFAFWTLCARIYPEQQVGIATALLAALNLITSIGLLGFEISIIRILPGRADKSQLLGACLGITSVVGVAAAIGFVALQPLVLPDLAIISESPLITLAFIGFVLVAVYSYMLESTFIALRSSKYVLIKNAVFSVSKLALPVFLVGLGAFGIYASWMVGLLIAVIVSTVLLARSYGISSRPRLNPAPLRGTLTYSLANYVASFAEGLPIMVLPLVVTSLYGPAANAHFYMAMMLAGLLYTVPVTITQSLLAEGSHDEAAIRQHTLKATKLIAALMVPGIIGLMLVGPYVLRLFGEGYDRDGRSLLMLLALSGAFLAANTVARTILKLRYQSGALVWVSLIGSLLTVGLCFPFAPLGLVGVGISWTIGQAVMLALYGVILGRPMLLSGLWPLRRLRPTPLRGL